MFKIIIGVLVVTFIVIFFFMKLDPNISSNSSLTSGSEDYITVSITGEVTRSGTYVLEVETLMSDLIESAGGITANADETAYMLACPLINSMSYYIAPLYATEDVCSSDLLTKVGLNSGQKEDFMTINGIGSSIATAIISYRDDNGDYQYIEEVMEVTGIGNATFEKMKNYITLS